MTNKTISTISRLQQKHAARKAKELHNAKQVFQQIKDTDPVLAQFLTDASEAFGKPSETPGAALAVKLGDEVVLKVGQFARRRRGVRDGN